MVRPVLNHVGCASQWQRERLFVEVRLNICNEPVLIQSRRLVTMLCKMIDLRDSKIRTPARHAVQSIQTAAGKIMEERARAGV